LHANATDIAQGKSSEGLSVIREAENKSGWKLIKNETFGFSLQVPASSHVEGHRISGNAEYIRIQNYQPSDSSGLKADMYWLEIFIFDHQARRKIWEPCSALLLNVTTESRNGLKIYRGDPRDKSPDTGGYVRSLCAEAGAFDIYVQAVESSKETPTINKIYDGFQVPLRR
jgi:hypothetical protein